MYKEYYKCSNPSCSFKISLWSGIPVWMDNTPEDMKGVPVAWESRKYVIGLVSHEFCARCGEVVEVINTKAPSYKKRILGLFKTGLFGYGEYIPENERVCPECGGNRFLRVGDPCPKCENGRIFENEDFRGVI